MNEELTSDEVDNVNNPLLPASPENLNQVSPSSQDHVINDSKMLWSAMEEYDSWGLSMMWNRTQDELVGNILKPAKSPLVKGWSSELSKRFSLKELAHTLASHPFTPIAPAIICGEGSKYLEVIDIDCKHNPGIEIRYFESIRQYCPETWDKLRIHKTRSNGYHLLYFCPELNKEPSRKLAYKKDAKEACIETRGHGACVVAPPGPGYSVYKDNPIPVLTKLERDQLIQIAVLFNEKVKPITPRNPGRIINNYEESPFKSFNNSPEAENVLIEYGWKKYKEDSNFIHFTRPDKAHGNSASYIKSVGLFHFFTSSSEFDSDKNYDPCAVICKLKFNDSYKELFRFLVKNEYGKFNAQYEKKAIRHYAEKGKNPPSNFRKDSFDEFEGIVQELKQKYPFGRFWKFDLDIQGYVIDRALLAHFMENFGFRTYNGRPCIIEGQFIRILEDGSDNYYKEVFDILKSWIKEDEEDARMAIEHVFSRFWQQAWKFMVRTLPCLDEGEILKSGTKICYKFFRNGILEITAQGHVLVPYDKRLDKKIWENEVKQFDFIYVPPEEQDKCKYVHFLKKATDASDNYRAIILGYLCCDYKIESEGYLIALLEPQDAKDGGGSGKGFFCLILAPWTSVLVTDGNALKRDKNLLMQNWDFQRIIHLSDLPRGIDIAEIKHMVTDSSQVKKLYFDIKNVSVDKMPKFIVSSQFPIMTENDGGIKRRYRPLPFTSYFNRKHTIRDEYGDDCPGVWTEEDWNGYFSYLTDCVQLYLQKRSIPEEEYLGLWAKEFDYRYSLGTSYLREAIEDNLGFWMNKKFVPNEQLWNWYTQLPCKPSIPDIKHLHYALQEYGSKSKHFRYEQNQRETVDKKQERGAKFYPYEDADESVI